MVHITTFLKENKVISTTLGVLFAGLMAWAVFVTQASYKITFGERLLRLDDAEKMERVCEDIEELKDTDKKILREVKEQKETIYQNQKEMLLLLIQIQNKLKIIQENGQRQHGRPHE